MLTRPQIDFAEQHDWFLEEAWDKEGTVYVRELTRLPDGTVDFKILWFDDFDKLKKWAGY